jgi:hypothetical protein
VAAILPPEGISYHLTLDGLLVIAATAKLGIYQYRSWWRWGSEWKPVKSMRLREVRLSREEVVVVIFGVALVLVAAVRETMMARGVL